MVESCKAETSKFRDMLALQGFCKASASVERVGLKSVAWANATRLAMLSGPTAR